MFVCPYILYADGQVGLEVVEVLCQLVAVVIVGEQALEKRQQLKETKKQHEVTSVTEEQVKITIRKKEREDETRLWMRETRWRVLKRKRTREIY